MDEIIEAVASRAVDHPYRIWGFGEGMALLGLLRAGERLGRPEWIDRVVSLVEPSLRRKPDPTDHLIPVEVLVELARLRRLDVGSSIQRLWNAVEGRLVHRPDLDGLSTTMWVDCMHTDGPGLPKEAAAGQIEEAALRLADPGGLFSHGYDTATGTANGVHWGRGQGWALHGLLAVGSPRVEPLLRALERYEMDGHWRTIVDDDTAPVEHSVSALLAAGLLSRADDRWRPMAERSLRAAVGALDGTGGLPVSSATPVGDRQTYVDRETGVYPWGQGPLLLALLAVTP